MIRNGLYVTTLTMALKKLDRTESVSRGVLVLRNGMMHSGGPFFYTIGSYSCSDGKWKGEATSREHVPANKAAVATRIRVFRMTSSFEGYLSWE
jgi:hypothetical protein